MKKNILFTLLVCVCLCFCGCKSSENVIGKWETVSLSKEGKEFDGLKSNMEIFEKDGVLNVRGCAGINLFICQMEVKGTKIKAFGMQNTGFGGSYSDLDYEDAFFTALMYADSYKIDGDLIYLSSSYQDAELVLKKINE